MKRVLFAIAASLLLLSCGKDYTVGEGDSSQDEKTLVGTWGLTHYTEVVKINGKVCNEDSEDGSFNPWNPTEECLKITISNYSNNQYLVTTYYYEDGAWTKPRWLSWEYKNNRFYETIEDWSLSYSYKLKENELILEGTETDYNYEYIDEYDNKQTVTAECYYKYVFERMNN